MSGLLVAGVDEVGRGPLAGPVITAAVILPAEFNLPGLNDSKKITAKRREVLSIAIKEQALAWAFGEANLAEIDDLNILHATMLAMQRAVAGLCLRPDKVMVDGNRCPDFGIPAQALVGGDGLHSAISAASIIAKVERDCLMKRYAKQYPNYGFERNSGYPTQQHREALIKYGVTPIHRRSFAPVKALL
ncbi:MAG: ribonuclease HII [Cryomorphaceae bacterium]|jgi:ribonuclease HII